MEPNVTITANVIQGTSTSPDVTSGVVVQSNVVFGIPVTANVVTGAKGDKGDTGATGPQGDTGPQGPQGNQGDAATIEVGTVTTVDPSDPATVTNSGTTSEAVFDFEIPQGETGATGATGSQGPQGNPGADGKTWYSGSGAPSGGTGANGDFYFRTDTGQVYTKSGGSWSAIANLTGPTGATGATGSTGAAGADGKTVLNGTVDPTTEGVNGDFYINTTSNEIFGPKTAGAWGSGTSLVGPQGDQGIQGDPGTDGFSVLSGSGAPGGGLGVNGDFYINTSNYDIYGPKAGGSWGSPTSLVGPAGAGSGDVNGPSGSIASEIALFDGTTGKLLKRATTTGILKAASGVLSAAAAGTDYVAPNGAITGATKTKITYDAKGLVTAGTDATQDDIGDGTTYKQYSATDKTKLAGIEAGADVTDAANVTAAGAFMKSVDDTDDITEGATKKFTTASDITKLAGIEALADVTDAGNVGSSIHGATGKTTPVDADTMPLIDSAASNVLKKVTWANIKATLKTYFDTLYQPLSAVLTSWAGKTVPSGDPVGTTDTQTLTNKTLSDVFLGNDFSSASGIPRDVTLTASTDFIELDSLEVASAYVLEIPATSSLEIIAYAPSTTFAARTVRWRQGGTTGDAAWNTAGTNNTDLTGKDIFIQCGTQATTGGGSLNVVFPVPFKQVPVVTATVITAVTTNAFARISAISTTQFTVQLIADTGAGSNNDFDWIAIGQ